MSGGSSSESSPSADETVAATGTGTGGAQVDASVRTPSQGESLGRYVILRELGRGGMGVVFAAYDPELDRTVALKYVWSHLSAAAAKPSRARLLREAQAMARVSHPNVVTVHDVGEHDEGVYIAMEFVEGVTVRQWAKEQPRPWTEVLEVFRRAGLGLEVAHEKGLVHRDFKPGNVMIEFADDGTLARVRVMDFGLARPSDEIFSHEGGDPAASHADGDAIPSETDLSRFVGTPAYMAPEQHAKRATDRRTDVFAWCVSLWETLYGAKPFGGDSPAELAIQVATGRLVEPPDQRGVPRWLRNILTRGLRPEPDDRWASMTDVRRALDRARVVRRRRLALAGVAVVGGVGLGVFGSLMARDRRIVSGCEQSAARFDAHWNSQRRAALEQAFAALELPYGNQSAQRLGQRLDEYVAQWRAAENESCLATELTGEISAQERALTRACLQDRMANIGSMLDQLEHVDPVAAAQAAGWSANLPPVADCRDPDQLAPYRDLPQGAAQDAEAIRAQLWRARTLLALGKPDEAVEPAAEAVARADAVSWPAMQAEALLLQASVRADRGDTPGARDLYQTAFGIAGEAHRDDLLLEIVHRLMFLEGVRMSNFEEAGVWTDVGRMLIRRQGIEDDPRASAFHLAHAAVLRSTAKYPEAAEEVQRALDLAEAATGVDHPANVPAMHTLAVLEFRLGKLDDAQSMLEHLLELIEADVGTKHPKYADVLVTLATVVDARGNPERGLALATESIELMRSARGPDHPTLVPLLSTAGAIALELGRLEQAADFMGRALELSERSEPTHLHHAELRINLAFIQLQLERFDAAERLSQRAIDTIEQLDLPDHPALTQAYAAHAAALLALQRYDQAAEEFDRVMHMPAWESAPPDVAAGITEGLAEAKQKGGRSSQ